MKIEGGQKKRDSKRRGKVAIFAIHGIAEIGLSWIILNRDREHPPQKKRLQESIFSGTALKGKRRLKSAVRGQRKGKVPSDHFQWLASKLRFGKTKSDELHAHGITNQFRFGEKPRTEKGNLACSSFFSSRQELRGVFC